jgi:hypothetical protein
MIILTQQESDQANLQNTIYVEGIPMLFNMDFISFEDQVMQSADAKHTGNWIRADLVLVEVKFREETVTVRYKNVDAARQLFFYNPKLPHVEAVFDTIMNYC